ncbi:MAG: ligase-associated DNA damage response exonuclease [Verrucomicrobiaceae bacterium]|nr:MAG: ligase-associated DNA damage response exonuclease [Verrucomicrobiaceae bacterium]
MSRAPVLQRTDCGLYCPAGDFYIDPWKPVDRAVITHAHSDHARWGMGSYLCSTEGDGVLRRRVGHEARIKAVDYGESLTIGAARVSLHPAGHILGSAQIRVEVNGEVAVVSGDYKTEPDRTCTPFEPVPCHLFVTESTFGLPIYHWPTEATLIEEIHGWWRANQAAGKASLLLGYALGKCQRALALLDPSVGPIFQHGAVVGLTNDYREKGIDLPPTMVISDVEKGFDWSQAMILAPPSAHGTPWTRRFGDHSTAFLSGWMAIRGARRRRAVDRGFVMSDHVDWPSLMTAIGETGAERVWVTHGYTAVVVRYLREQGLDAEVLATHWEEEPGDSELGEEGG